MKIYAYTDDYSELDDFLGEDLWVLARLGCQGYRIRKFIKVLSKSTTWYGDILYTVCYIKDLKFNTVEDVFRAEDIEILKPVDVYTEDELREDMMLIADGWMEDI
jgi:hypothetical protein